MQIICTQKEKDNKESYTHKVQEGSLQSKIKPYAIYLKKQKDLSATIRYQQIIEYELSPQTRAYLSNNLQHQLKVVALEHKGLNGVVCNRRYTRPFLPINEECIRRHELDR